MASLSSHRVSALPRRTSSTFCYWIKRWRAYLGVTQRRFAELWGVSPSLVQKIEIDEYSVSQLSFERLEALRTLLKLPSSTFYALIATHPDTPLEAPQGETVQVQRLEPGMPPVSFAKGFLGEVSPHQLSAFTIFPTDLAPDRWRYRLQEGALVVLDRVALPKPGRLSVALVRDQRRERRALYPVTDEPLFLRPFDPESDTVLEPQTSELEPLGVVIGHWVSLNVH